MSLERIFSEIDGQFDRYVTELQEFCRKPSIAAQNLGMEEAAEHLQARMEAAGIQARVIPVPGGFPVVYGEIKGKSDRTLLFYNHYDVQPPEPLELWDSPPFAAEIRGGAIYARGVSDNKGNAMARIQAVEAFLRTRGELPVTVKFVVEGEEEIGSPHLPRFVEENRELLKAEAGIWEAGYKDYQGRPTVSLGVKGICYLELEARGARQDLHSAMATIVPNPAWRLIWALSTFKNEREEILIDGFYDDVVEPTAEELAVLRDLPQDDEVMRRELGIDSFVLGLSGLELKIKHLLKPTCNICGFGSGYTGEGQKTVLPARAMAKVDFRLVPNQDPADIEKKVRAHLQKHGFGDITVRAYSNEHPARTPLNSPIVKVIKESAQLVYGQPPVIYPTMAGSGPMPLFVRDLGIPMASIGVGHSGSANHAPNENIRLEDYRQGIKMIAAVIDGFAR